MFDTDRALHSLGVANFMLQHAGTLGLKCDAAWFIGFNHDIGYIVSKYNHTQKGVSIVEEFSEELAKYVGLHDAITPIIDNMDFLLRLADLVIDGKGNVVGINMRIREVFITKGAESAQHCKDILRAIETYANIHQITLHKECI